MAILAEKYASDYTWYVDVILNLIRIAGDYVSEEVSSKLDIHILILIKIQLNKCHHFAAAFIHKLGKI